MAVALGKRKTRDEADESHDPSEDEEDLRARFQRAFEAKFRPLNGTKKSKRIAQPIEVEVGEDGEDDESDWEGLSDDSEDYNEDSGEIEVIDHGTSMPKDEDEERDSEKKAFMSSKPPSASTNQPRAQKPQAKDPSSSNDPSEATNKAHDIALQRLLKESHLLDPASFSSSSGTASSSALGSASLTNPTGKSRIKALDLRLQNLGSAQAYEKMPMAMRKGIAAKAARREENRRSEAKENGIVLERPSAVSSKGRGAAFGTSGGMISRGVRGGRTGAPRGAVGAPGIGRMRGGTLTLSRKDVREIEGGRGSRKSHGKGRGGFRGKRGARR